MKRFFDTSKPRIMETDYKIFPLNSNKYIVPCSLYLKILPSLKNGIEVVGFINNLLS